MRVISGKYKNKKLEGFDIDGTRPTMDRVKESLFGMIQNELIDSSCLDLFAGSGSLGIEALSNGASICYFVENNKEMSKILKNNLNKIEDAIIEETDYKRFIKDNNFKFDIVFLDPPYKLNLINNAINSLIEYDLLNDNALLICELENEKIKTSLELIKDKKYGSKYIKIYKFKKEN